MKPYLFVAMILMLITDVVYAWPPAVEPPTASNKNKVCWVGSTGFYIRAHEECIDTQIKCDARGGKWGGTESGLGHSPGCNLPTTDGGERCSDSSQCQAACLAGHMPTPVSGPPPAQQCHCSDWMRSGKGQQPNLCSFKGVVYGNIVD